MRKNPQPNEIYKHFKGNLYRIITLATHSETREAMVVYQALYGDYQAYVRELSMFMSETDKKKYPEVQQQYRFELIPQIPEAVCVAVPDASVSAPAKADEPALDPGLVEFMDAETYREKLNLLSALHPRITDEMINTMAIVLDVEINEGDTEERYLALKNCLLTMEKYEGSRLR